MAETTERREVHTDFTATDAGLGQAIGRITGGLERAAHRVEGLHERLTEFRREQGFTAAGLFGVGFGLGAIIEKAREATAEFGRTQKGIASVIAQNLAFEKGVSGTERFTRSMVLAREVTEKLDETSARFGIGLGEVDTAYRKTAITAGRLGLTQQQVLDLSIKEAAAAKAYGVSGEQAATTIARVLTTKTVRGVDEFSLSLKGALGDMKKLSTAQVFERVQKALKDSEGIADAMSRGIGGSLARIRNTVEDTLRDVAAPVFAKVSQRLESWAKHLREAREQGKPLIDLFADRLVSAFDKIERATAFIMDHWKAIAAVVGGVKLSGVATGLAGAAASLAARGVSAGGAIGGAAGAIGGAGASLAKGLSIASAAIQVTGTAYLLGGAIGEAILGGRGQDDQRLDAQRRFGALDVLSRIDTFRQQAPFGMLTAQQEKLANLQIKRLEKEGIISEGRIDRAKLAEAVRDTTQDDRLALARRLRIRDTENTSTVVADRLASALEPLVGVIAARTIRTPKANDEELKFAKRVNNFYGGIHNTFKIDESVDPDRIFVRALDEIEGFADRRTQGDLADPYGD